MTPHTFSLFHLNPNYSAIELSQHKEVIERRYLYDEADLGGEHPRHISIQKPAFWALLKLNLARGA